MRTGRKFHSLRTKESFRSVTFSDGGKSATVISIISIDGKEEKPNFQSWNKENGKWFRNYGKDNPEKFAEIRKKTNKQHNALSEPSIYSLTTAWNFAPEGNGRVRATPQTKVVIQNSGSYPISDLRIKVDYFDKNQGTVMYSKDRHVVTEGDTPLKAGEKSALIFLDSGVGFVFDSAFAAQLDNFKHLSGSGGVKDRIERRFYFKRGYSDEWISLSTSNLVDSVE